MKKIEAIIKRAKFTKIGEELNILGYTIIDKRNLEHNKIVDQQKGSKIGSRGFKTIPLSKIELVVSNKDAKRVIDIISKKSGLASNDSGKIFISEMEEVVDIKTLKSKKDLEDGNERFLKKPIIKKSRLVPLQKFTLMKIQRIYDENQETLRTDYRIKSFSDFVNYCIMGYLPTMEKQLKHPRIIYENKYREF